MSKYNEMPFLRLLLKNEAGIDAPGCNDSDLKPAYERNRKRLFVNDKDDKGGATMCGVTWRTFCRLTKDNDYDHFLQMSYERWCWICTRCYWDKLRASEMNSVQLAVAVCDYAFNSGEARAVHSLQEALNELNVRMDYRLGKPLFQDGVLGEKTLAMIQKLSRKEQLVVLYALQHKRTMFVQQCVAHGKISSKFLHGLMARICWTGIYSLSLG